MTEQEIGAKLSDIAGKLRMLDLAAHINGDGTYTLNERQGEVVNDTLELLRALNWQIKFNAFKELRCDESEAIRPSCVGGGKPGTLVRVRSCLPQHSGKTRLGVLIGDVARGVRHVISDDGVVTTSFSYHNPAIILLESNEIVYGCECWWCKITGPDELDRLITDGDIQSTWYVKAIMEAAKMESRKEGMPDVAR